MRAEIHKIEAAGDDLQNAKRDKQTADLAEASVGIGRFGLDDLRQS